VGRRALVGPFGLYLIVQGRVLIRSRGRSRIHFVLSKNFDEPKIVDRKKWMEGDWSRCVETRPYPTPGRGKSGIHFDLSKVIGSSGDLALNEALRACPCRPRGGHGLP
jgi:hypothetical protein